MFYDVIIIRVVVVVLLMHIINKHSTIRADPIMQSKTARHKTTKTTTRFNSIHISMISLSNYQKLDLYSSIIQQLLLISPHSAQPFATDMDTTIIYFYFIRLWNVWYQRSFFSSIQSIQLSNANNNYSFGYDIVATVRPLH